MNHVSLYIFSNGCTNNMRAIDRRAGKAIGCGGVRSSDQYSVVALIAGSTRGGVIPVCTTGFSDKSFTVILCRP